MSAAPLPHHSPAPAAAPAFQQRLGLFDSTMLVAGTMIGSGIFIVSADIARDVGSAGWLLALWVLTGFMTIIGALSYAELASMMPHAGGQYVYLREAYSPLWGFLYGWTVFLVIQTGSIAAVAVAFAKFLGVLVPRLGTENFLFTSAHFRLSAGQLVAAGVITLLTVLNCRGVREGKWVQNIFTVAKTLALVVLIAVGLTAARNAAAISYNLQDLWDGIYHTPRYTDVAKFLGAGGLLVALMVAGGAMVGSLFSADAWNNITFTAGEVRNPRRNLPLSLVCGTGLVITLYIVANLAYLSALPVKGDAALAGQLKTELEAANKIEPPAARAHAVAEVNRRYQEATFQLGIDHARDDRVATATLERAAPALGVPFMAVAIMISTFGCVNGMALMGARLYYAMARDGLFFRAVGQLNARGVPAAGMRLQGLWSILLIFSGTYSQLLDYVMFAALLFYVLTVVGLFVLRRKQPHAERPYRAFGYPVVPAVYVLLCAAIMLDLLVVKPLFTWPGLLIVLTGIPVYFLWRARARLAKA
jgi:APA family basic amino acid/polyamine antiporter